MEFLREIARRLTIAQALVLLVVVLALMIALVATTSRPPSEEERFATATPAVNPRNFAPIFTPTFIPTPPGS